MTDIKPALNPCWVPIALALPGEPAAFDYEGVSIIMTARFDEGVFFYRAPSTKGEP